LSFNRLEEMRLNIESFVVDEVVRRARADGWLARPLAWRGRRDAPDYFFVRLGRVVLIEFKSPGEKPRPGQAREIQRLRNAGVEIHVADTVEKGVRALRAAI
jgi:hypothetical protein